jgi:hypothetical protein
MQDYFSSLICAWLQTLCGYLKVILIENSFSLWKEKVRWLGIQVAFVKGGYEHYQMFRGLISGKANLKEVLSIIWLSTVHSIWKARNQMIFNWEKVVDEIKFCAWKVLKARAKYFTWNAYKWKYFI